jgi:hypothetical protein
MEQWLELKLVGETEVEVENPYQYQFVRHKSHITGLGIEVEIPQWSPNMRIIKSKSIRLAGNVTGMREKTYTAL